MNNQLRMYNGSFITVKQNDSICLYCKNKISKRTLVAEITFESMVIYNRDFLNLFIEYNNLDLKDMIEFDKLSENEIKTYAFSILEKDLLSLARFNVDTYNEIYSLLEKFTIRLKNNLLKRMKDFDIINVPCLKVDSEKLAELLDSKGFYYLYFNLNDVRYRLSTSNAEKVFCRKGYSSWKKAVDDENCYIFFFNKRNSYNDIKTQLNEDLKESCYAPAERFMKLEDFLSKSFDNIISNLTEQNGFLSSDMMLRVNLDKDIEDLTLKARTYLSEKDGMLKQQLFLQLEKAYFDIYHKLDESKDSLKRLCTKLG